MLQREAAEVLVAHGIAHPSPGEILELMDELVLRVVNRTMLRRQAVVLSWRLRNSTPRSARPVTVSTVELAAAAETAPASRNART